MDGPGPEQTPSTEARATDEPVKPPVQTTVNAGENSQPAFSMPEMDHEGNLASDVHCRRCGYNLRGLPEPRCPECGYRFEWQEVLDPQRRKHPYLFEHHPERIWSSFWRTQWGGLFPRSFWRALHPSQPSRPGRIIIYCLLSTLPIAIGSIAWIVAQAGLNLDMLTYALNYLSFRADGALYMALSYVLLPWLTLAALLIFQISMRRARVKQSHVLRTVCYSYDIAVIALAAALAAAALAADHWTIYLWITSNVWSSMADTDMFLFWGAWLFAPVMALIVYRIGTAYQRYLKFRHPYLTVALSQIVVFLILVVGWMQLIW
jgi:ribosomal protein L37E